MRFVFLFTALTALGLSQPTMAQFTSNAPLPRPNTPQERLALSTKSEKTTSGSSMRLACAPLGGQVFDPNGQPLLGATLLIKGTHQVYVTDSEGKFLLTEPVYQGQVLTVQAAGYTARDVSLDNCTLPRLVLEQAVGAHIKRSGKRAGQVIRLDHRSTNMK